MEMRQHKPHYVGEKFETFQTKSASKRLKKYLKRHKIIPEGIKLFQKENHFPNGIRLFQTA